MQKSSRASKAAAKNTKKLNFLAWLIPLCAVVLVLLVGFIMKSGNTIYPNVTVCGVQVGGMNYQEAVDAVTLASAKTYESETLMLHLPDRTLRLRPEDTGVSLDAYMAVDLALEYGREGGPVSALVNWFRCKKTEHDVDLSSALTMNESYLQQLAHTTAVDVETRLQQSEVSYDEETKTISVRMGFHEKKVDTEKMVAAVVDAYSRGDFQNAAYEYDITYCDPVDLTEYYKELCTPMKDAEYDEETNTMTKEVLGFGFDLEKEQQRVNQAEEGALVTIVLGDMVPEVTVDTLKEKYFPDVLAAYSSPHTNIPARTNNLVQACAAIDGTVLNPGEVFSFNKIVGERTAAKGYKAATVYNGGGESVPELGGGVCQVASTIYMCTLLADLEVVERTEHMYAVTYVPMGMDATIYWGSLDYKFRNSTEYPILVEASVSGGKNHITLRGTQTSDETIKMTYSVLATIPWEEVEEVDETKEPDFKEEKVTPYTGYKVQTYKERYDKDGNLISSKKEAFSNYKKRDKVWTVGPKPEEVPPEGTEVAPPAEGTVTPAPEVPVTPAPEVPAPEAVTPPVEETPVNTQDV